MNISHHYEALDQCIEHSNVGARLLRAQPWLGLDISPPAPTSAQGEGQSIALVARVRPEDDVDGGVVRVRVDGVTAVTLQRGGEPGQGEKNIDNVDSSQSAYLTSLTVRSTILQSISLHSTALH